jgi:SNF2 family DNA or RNA helicase
MLVRIRQYFYPSLSTLTDLNAVCIVITTFDLARRDIDVLDGLPWSCIIVDEVHRVKNEASKITMAYHQFACLNRFGLTGTTIQNSYKEMWTILDWTNPGRLGTARQWQGYVVKPLTAGQSAGASEEERAKALQVAMILRDKLLPNFFLRRYGIFCVYGLMLTYEL